MAPDPLRGAPNPRGETHGDMRSTREYGRDFGLMNGGHGGPRDVSQLDLHDNARGDLRGETGSRSEQAWRGRPSATWGVASGVRSAVGAPLQASPEMVRLLKARGLTCPTSWDPDIHYPWMRDGIRDNDFRRPSAKKHASLEDERALFHRAPGAAAVHDQAGGEDYSLANYFRQVDRSMLEKCLAVYPIEKDAKGEPKAGSLGVRGSVSTIALMIDFIMAGKFLDAVETGVRRLQAVGQAKVDGNWKGAQGVESVSNTYRVDGLISDHALLARTYRFMKNRAAANKGP
jgi:hypothetical protein